MRAIGLVLALTLVAGAATSVSADPPGGVPPGLAKKGVDRHEWQAHKGWKTGERLPRGEYIIIRDYDRYGLRRPRAGQSYYVVDGEVLRVIDATREIAEAIGAVSALLN